MSPDTLSQAELQTNKGADQIQKIIDEANQHAQIKDEADLIYTQIKDQLVETGRLSPQTAGYSAQIIPAYVTVKAARTGKTAKEIYELMGLKIEGPERRKAFDNPVAAGKIQPVEGDRRADTGRGERRNPDLRAEFEALPEEEKFKIAYEDPLTGMRTKRAWDQLPAKKFRIMLDLDGLGWVNDNKGHEAGNVFLKEASRAIQEYLGTEDAFRIGGDEFAGQSDDFNDAQTKAQAIQDHLKNVTIEVRNPGEEPFTIKGIGVSYGIGENDAIADQKLYEDKARREATGERAKKGNRPPGIEPGPGDTARADQTGGNDQDTGLILNQSARGEGFEFSKAKDSVSELKPTNEELRAWNLGKKHRGELDGKKPNTFFYENMPQTELDFVSDMEANSPVQIAFYESALRGAKMPRRAIGWRFGKAKDKGVSKNYTDDTEELGISMAGVDGVDYQWYPMAKVGEPNYYEGWLFDPDEFRGSDNEPLMVGLTKTDKSSAAQSTESFDQPTDYSFKDNGDPVALANVGFTPKEIRALEKAGLATDGKMSIEQKGRYNNEASNRLNRKQSPPPTPSTSEEIGILEVGIKSLEKRIDNYSERLAEEHGKDVRDDSKIENLYKAIARDTKRHGELLEKLRNLKSQSQVSQVLNQEALETQPTDYTDDPNILKQENRGQIQFTDEGAIIRMLESSDLSTFLHESAHLFLNIEAQLAGTELTKDQQIILDWLGVKSFSEITRDHHEQFARGFEAYLFEGKAPSIELRDSFSRFRDWLLQIYQSLTNLKVDLNKDIRSVFDRMLATDEQINIAHNQLNYDILFDSAESAGMTTKEWEDYQLRKQRAKDKPKATLQEKILKQLRRETEKWWKDELYAKRAEVREEIKDLPEYRAMEFLKEHKSANKINRDLLKETLGVTDVPPKLRKTSVVNGGLNPDEVAVMFGYKNGHEMLTDLVEKPLFTQRVNAEAEARMKAEHGDILNDGTMEREAMEAAHDEERASVLFIELRKLSRTQNVDRETLKQKAKDVIKKTKISEIRPDKYRRAEIRSAQKSRDAFNRGDKAGAAEAKAQQIANFYLWKAANEARTRADSQRKYLSGVSRRSYDGKKVAPEYIRQMKLLSSVYDFRKGNHERSASELSAIATWIKTQIENEDNYIVPSVLDQNLAVAMDNIKNGQPVSVKHYNDMTVEELNGVYDQVKHLRYVGGKLSDTEKSKFLALIDRVSENIRLNGKKTVTVPEERSRRDKVLEKLRQAGQDHLGLANHIEELDGYKEFGPMFESFYQGIINSTNEKLRLNRETGKKLIDAFKNFRKKDLKQGARERTVKRESGQDWTLSARGRVMLALYWGSPESREAILQAHGVTESDAQKMLDFITDEEIQLVQDIWKINESLWPQLRDTAIELTGVSPPKVEHIPFTIRDKTLPGGYMRIFYEEDVRDSILLDVDTMGKITRSGSRLMQNTRHGARNARVGSGGRKMSWDLNNVFRALDENIHDIAFAKTAIDSTRFLKSEEIRNAIAEKYGLEKYKAIRQTLSNIIAGHVDGGNGFWNSFFRVPRIAGTYAFLGYSVRNFIQQPIAMTNMLGRIGEKEMFSALMDVYWSPKKYIKFAQDRSEFIRNRTTLVNREVSEAIGKIDSGIMSGPLKRHAFDLQTVGDALAVYPGWVAAYRKGLDKFANEKKAITYADEVIAETIGSGSMKDMSPLLQGKATSTEGMGPEQLKLLTFMYSYFNIVGRLTRSAAKRNDLGTIKGFSNYSREMVWYLIAPALISAWAVGQGPDEDENWLLWVAENIGLYRLSQFIGLRELSGLIQGFRPSSPYTRALEGGRRVVKTAADVIEGEKELFDPATISAILRGASTVIPMPGAGQVARTLDYIGSNPDEFNIYDALIVGKKYE